MKDNVLYCDVIIVTWRSRKSEDVFDFVEEVIYFPDLSIKGPFLYVSDRDRKIKDPLDSIQATSFEVHVNIKV